MKWTRKETLDSREYLFVSKALTHHEPSFCTIPRIIAVKTVKAKEFEIFSNEKDLLMNKLKGCSFILRRYGDEFSTEDNMKLYNVFLEYASGGCLLDRMVPNKGMSENLVRKYLRSVLVALSHTHKQGYVHCDVKPSNILLVQESGGQKVAKLADFCLAKRIRNNEEPIKGESFVGTCMYAAPESILSKEYGPKSDIWSLGVTVWLMLTGKPPPKLQKELYHLHFMKQIGSQLYNKLSVEAKDFLTKCLVKDPRDRSSSATLLHHPFMLKESSSSSRFHSIFPTTHCFHMSDKKMVHAS